MSTSSANYVTSIASVLFVVLFIGGLVLNGVAVGDGPDASRDGIATTLTDIDDHGTIYLLAWAVDLASVFVYVLLVAALYFLVRDREPMLALTFFAFTLTGAVAFVASDIAYSVLFSLAADFVEGGAGGATAATVLEVARAVTWVGDLAGVAGLSLLGTGFVALGALVVWSPQSGGATAAASSIPRWLGWLSIGGGLLALVVWLGTIDAALYIVPLLGFVGLMVFLMGLAVWLVRGHEGAPAD